MVEIQPQPQVGIPPYTLRPSREWYLLLAGLLTRAALEGYLTAGWIGLEAVQCLLGVGLGLTNESTNNDSEGDFKEFDPEGLPSLKNAVKILFPALRTRVAMPKGEAEAEYEADLRERLRRVSN